MRKIILTAAVCILCKVSYCQTANHLFEKLKRSIETNINYPDFLTAHCIQTSAMIKIHLDSLGAVSADISDSAEQLLKVDFLVIIPKINVEELRSFQKKYNKTNVTLLIPIYFHVKDCLSQNLDADLIRKFTSFDGHPYTDSAFVSTPIDLTIIRQVR